MIKFQRRHFEFIAEVLKTAEAPKEVVDAFVANLIYTNSRFDASKFIEACGDSIH